MAAFFFPSWTHESLFPPPAMSSLSILKEGISSKFFESFACQLPQLNGFYSSNSDMKEHEDDEEEIDMIVFYSTGNHTKDIMLVWNHSHEPAPENIPNGKIPLISKHADWMEILNDGN